MSDRHLHTRWFARTLAMLPARHELWGSLPIKDQCSPGLKEHKTTSVSLKTTPSSPIPLLPCLKTQPFASAMEGTSHQLPYAVGDHPLQFLQLPWSFIPTHPYTLFPFLRILQNYSPGLGERTAPVSCIPLVIKLTPTAAQQD